MAEKAKVTPHKFKIKTGDLVVIIAGKDKGEEGKVVQVLRDKDRVLVEGKNLAKKHIKARPQAGRPGEIVQRAMPIHISNVMLIDPHSNKPSRVGRKELNGKMVRFAKRSGELVDTD